MLPFCLRKMSPQPLINTNSRKNGIDAVTHTFRAYIILFCSRCSALTLPFFLLLSTRHSRNVECGRTAFCKIAIKSDEMFVLKGILWISISVFHIMTRVVSERECVREANTHTWRNNTKKIPSHLRTASLTSKTITSSSGHKEMASTATKTTTMMMTAATTHTHKIVFIFMLSILLFFAHIFTSHFSHCHLYSLERMAQQGCCLAIIVVSIMFFLR